MDLSPLALRVVECSGKGPFTLDNCSRAVIADRGAGSTKGSGDVSG